MSHEARTGADALESIDPDPFGPLVDSTRLFADAATVLALWANPMAWVQRRVEHLDLVDSGWVRRSVTLRVNVPWTKLDDVAKRHLNGALLPISVSGHAARLVNVDLTDGSRRVLAIASRQQMVTVVGAAIGLSLHGTSENVEREKISAVAASAAHALVTGTASPDALDVFEALPAPLFSLVSALISQRLVLVTLPRDDAAHVIRCAWEEEIVRAPGVLARVRGALSGVTLMADIAGAGDYHLEATAPPSLAIEDVTFISATGRSSPALERARDHIEVPFTGSGQVFLRLRPATSALSLQLTLALVALGMALALIAATPISVTQSAAAALLLVLPGVLTLSQSRIADWFSFVEFGGARQLVFVSTFVAAAALSIGGGSGEAVQELLAVSAGGTAIAAGALAALGLSGLRRVRPGTAARSPVFVSYRAESAAAPVYPDDREIEQVVEDLINGLPTFEQLSPTLTPGGVDLQEAAGVLAERSSWIVSPRPAAPILSGDLLEDVLALTGMSRNDLAAALAASVAELAPGREGRHLSTELRYRLAALRTVGLTLYGGLGTAGVKQWLTTGMPTPIAAIADGRVEEVRAKLDRYMTSPAE